MNQNRFIISQPSTRVHGVIRGQPRDWDSRCINQIDCRGSFRDQCDVDHDMRRKTAGRDGDDFIADREFVDVFANRCDNTADFGTQRDWPRWQSGVQVQHLHHIAKVQPRPGNFNFNFAGPRFGTAECLVLQFVNSRSGSFHQTACGTLIRCKKSMLHFSVRVGHKTMQVTHAIPQHHLVFRIVPRPFSSQSLQRQIRVRVTINQTCLQRSNLADNDSANPNQRHLNR